MKRSTDRFLPPLPSRNNRPGRSERSIAAKLDLVTRLLLICFVLLVCPYSSFAHFTGRVVAVLDGDTTEVLRSQHSERIRLNGVDCPEKGQAYGKRAKQAASELVYGKEVTLQTHGAPTPVPPWEWRKGLLPNGKS